MYRLELILRNHTVIAFTVTLDELYTIARTMVEGDCQFELIKNKKSLFFDDLEELRLYLKEI